MKKLWMLAMAVTALVATAWQPTSAEALGCREIWSLCDNGRQCCSKICERLSDGSWCTDGNGEEQD